MSTLCIILNTSRISISRQIPITAEGSSLDVSCVINVNIDMFCTYRYTVPVLWDKKNHTIVNNESSEIIRIFNTAFNDFIAPNKVALDFYPENLRAEIDDVNEWIYPNINSKLISSCYLAPVQCNVYLYLQTASTGLGLLLPKRHTRKLSTRFSRLWIKPRSFSLGRNILLETNLPRRT